MGFREEEFREDVSLRKDIALGFARVAIGCRLTTGSSTIPPEAGASPLVAEIADGAEDLQERSRLVRDIVAASAGHRLCRLRGSFRFKKGVGEERDAEHRSRLVEADV